MILPATEETSPNLFLSYSNESIISQAQKINTGISYLKLTPRVPLMAPIKYPEANTAKNN